MKEKERAKGKVKGGEKEKENIFFFLNSVHSFSQHV